MDPVTKLAVKKYSKKLAEIQKHSFCHSAFFLLHIFLILLSLFYLNSFIFLQLLIMLSARVLYACFSYFFLICKLYIKILLIHTVLSGPAASANETNFSSTHDSVVYQLPHLAGYSYIDYKYDTFTIYNSNMWPKLKKKTFFF